MVSKVSLFEESICQHLIWSPSLPTIVIQGVYDLFSLTYSLLTHAKFE